MKPVTLALLASKPNSSGQRGREESDVTKLITPSPRPADRLKGKWACSLCGGTNVYEEDGKLRCMDCDGGK